MFETNPEHSASAESESVEGGTAIMEQHYFTTEDIREYYQINSTERD